MQQWADALPSPGTGMLTGDDKQPEMPETAEDGGPEKDIPGLYKEIDHEEQARRGRKRVREEPETEEQVRFRRRMGLALQQWTRQESHKQSKRRRVRFS